MSYGMASIWPLWSRLFCLFWGFSVSLTHSQLPFEQLLCGEPNNKIPSELFLSDSPASLEALVEESSESGEDLTTLLLKESFLILAKFFRGTLSSVFCAADYYLVALT